MFYTEKRTEENKRRLRRDVFKMLLAMLPFFALCAAGFAVRNQTPVSYTHLTLPTTERV